MVEQHERQQVEFQPSRWRNAGEGVVSGGGPVGDSGGPVATPPCPAPTAPAWPQPVVPRLAAVVVVGRARLAAAPRLGVVGRAPPHRHSPPRLASLPLRPALAAPRCAGGSPQLPATPSSAESRHSPTWPRQWLPAVGPPPARLQFGSRRERRIIASPLTRDAKWVVCLGALLESDFDTQNTIQDPNLGLGHVVGDSLSCPTWVVQSSSFYISLCTFSICIRIAVPW